MEKCNEEQSTGIRVLRMMEVSFRGLEKSVVVILEAQKQVTAPRKMDPSHENCLTVEHMHPIRKRRGGKKTPKAAPVLHLGF